MKLKKVTLAACAVAAGTAASLAQALPAVGLTADQRIVRFDTARPDRLHGARTLSGFANDTALVGIDYRVQDGKLYGVGNAGGVYTIDVGSGSLSFVNRLSESLVGTSFGVDFNPAADRLRIISNTGLNLRHNVNIGGVTLKDGNLSYTTDVTANNVGGAAYTNNDLDTNTGTTLFVIDPVLDQLVLQSPPNNGSLVAVGKLTADAAIGPVAFDIRSKLAAGATFVNTGVAVFGDAGGLSNAYDVNLLTGKAALIGAFPTPMIDLAMQLAP